MTCSTDLEDSALLLTWFAVQMYLSNVKNLPLGQNFLKNKKIESNVKPFEGKFIFKKRGKIDV